MGKLAVKLYHWHMKKTSKKESLQIKQMKYEIPPKKKTESEKWKISENIIFNNS